MLFGIQAYSRCALVFFENIIYFPMGGVRNVTIIHAYTKVIQFTLPEFLPWNISKSFFFFSFLPADDYPTRVVLCVINC